MSTSSNHPATSARCNHPTPFAARGIDRLCDEERDVPHAREHPRLAPTQLHPVVERDDDAEEDRAVRIAERDVDGGGGDRRDDRCERPAIANGQRGRPDEEEDDGERVDPLAIGLVVRRPERADDLEHADRERRQHDGTREVDRIGFTVGLRSLPVVTHGTYPVLRSQE